VTHLNWANPADFTAAQRVEIARLNEQASHEAQAKIAYDHALAFARHGLAWLDANGETAEAGARALWVSLHLAGAQAATRAGAFAETERLLDNLQAQANSVWERVAATQARMFAFYLRGQHPAAVQAALAILPELGVPLLPGGRTSATAVKLAIGRRLAQVEIALRGKPVPTLAQLPPLNNRPISTSLEIMAAVTISAAATQPQLLALIGLEMVWQTVRHGAHPLSALGYAIYGVFLCGVLGRIERGYAFGQLALQLAPAIATKEYRLFISYFVHAHIAHWRDPIADTLQPLRDLSQSGHYEYLALAAGLYPYFTWFINEQDIAVNEQAIANNMYLLEPFRDTPLFYRYQFGRQYLQNLLGWSEHPGRLAGEAYPMDNLLPVHIAAQDRTTLFYLAAHQLVLAYLFGDMAEAQKAAQLAADYADGGVGTPLIPVICLYESLTLLAQGAQWRKVEQNQRRMARWAAHSPANCLHRHTLVAAEMARVKGDSGRARELYDLAIAQAEHFLPELALAHELAARFYAGIGQSAYARHHAQAARDRYQRWGAMGKAAHVEQMLADYVPATAVADQPDWAKVAAYVDGTAVLQAAQILAQQASLPQLLERLASLLKENAGAQISYLLLPEGDRWPIVTPHPAEAVIAEGVVRQVVQTGEPYLSNHSAQRETAGIAASILCLPLADQGELVGLCYMENDLTGGLFQREALPTLTILAEMAAIAIKNSLLAAQLHTAQWQAETNELAAIELERQRIAQEIHDGVAQDMAFLRLKIALWRDWIATSPERMPPELDEATSTLDGAIQEIRRAIYALRPLILEKEGLLAALTRMVADLNDQHDLYITLRLEFPQADLPHALELPLYRVAQESLNNVIQHARATQAWVTLAAVDDGVCLMIRDNGVGFEVSKVAAPSAAPHFGLQQMGERIEQARGRLTVESRPAAGTEVRVCLPLPNSYS
jgi:signal transduction histidine kinase